MGKFHLEIVTPDGLVFDSEADSVRVRTITGDVEIMRGHTDFFAALSVGEIRLTVDGVSRLASSSGGFVSVKGGEVRIVATTLEFADEIDVNRAREAKENAEAAIQRAKDDKSILIAKAKLERALNRLSVAGKGR